MRIDRELAEAVSAAGDCAESRARVGAMIGERYAEKTGELENAKREFAALWDPVAADFGRLVAGATGHGLFYDKYVCVVCAFARGASNWSGNKIGVGYHVPEDHRRRLVAWELVLSHAYHIVREHYPVDVLTPWQVWAFSEIASAFVLAEESFRPLWPAYSPPQVHFDRSYPQLVPLEGRLWPLYNSKGSFKQYLDAAVPILRTFHDAHKRDAFVKSPTHPPEEKHLQIVDAGVARDADGYVATMQLGGDLPETTGHDNVVIEWDFLIDADQDPGTEVWIRGDDSLGLKNDIGVDYLVRLWLHGSRRQGEVWTKEGDRRITRPAACDVSSNTIRLRFLPRHIGGSTQFDYVVLARKLDNRDGRPSLLCYDKRPKEGHFTLNRAILWHATCSGRG